MLSQTDGLLGQLARLRLGGRALYLVSEEREGGPLLAELAPPSDRTTLVLPAGAYFVQQRLPAEYREYQVQLAPGSDTDLSARGYRSVQYDRLVRYRGSQKLYAHNLGLFAVCVVRCSPARASRRSWPSVTAWTCRGCRCRLGCAGAGWHGRSSDGLLENTHYELAWGCSSPAMSMSGRSAFVWPAARRHLSPPELQRARGDGRPRRGARWAWSSGVSWRSICRCAMVLRCV